MTCNNCSHNCGSNCESDTVEEPFLNVQVKTNDKIKDLFLMMIAYKAYD